VTNLYVRDSLLTDMAADEKTRRDAGSVRTDQIGKVFTVLSTDVRQCLLCEGVFTRRAASEHATVPCMLEFSTKTPVRGVLGARISPSLD
jgi:hypothetical protein